jgi:hypothetical protein
MKSNEVAEAGQIFVNAVVGKFKELSIEESLNLSEDDFRSFHAALLEFWDSKDWVSLDKFITETVGEK